MQQNREFQRQAKEWTQTYAVRPGPNDPRVHHCTCPHLTVLSCEDSYHCCSEAYNIMVHLHRSAHITVYLACTDLHGITVYLACTDLHGITVCLCNMTSAAICVHMLLLNAVLYSAALQNKPCMLLRAAFQLRHCGYRCSNLLTWAFHTKQFHKHCFPLVVMLMLLWSVFLAANISPRLLDPSELFLSISQTALARLDCYDSQLQAHVEFSCNSCSRCKNCKTCELLPMWYRLQQNCFGTALVYCVCLA